MGKAVLTWFSPGDTLFVENSWSVRVVEYDDEQVTLEVSPRNGADSNIAVIRREWTVLVDGLEVYYRGIFVNERCDPARMAGIHFRDVEAVDVRQDTFKGVPVHPPLKLGS